MLWPLCNQTDSKSGDRGKNSLLVQFTEKNN